MFFSFVIFTNTYYILQFANEDIATKMRAINANKYMNTTMTFEQVVPLRIPSPILNNEEMYLETTIINDDCGFICDD